MSANPPTKLARYASIYGALWKNSVSREMGFKANFILWIIVEMLWFALQLTFFNVIYSHTDSIAGWTRWEVVLLIGASHFIQQIFQAFFLTNCTQLSDLVRTGKLDFLLLLPVNTRFIVSVRQVDLGGFVNAATAVGVMWFALHKLQIQPSFPQIAGFLALAVCGVFLHYSLMMLLSATSFWTVRAQGIVWGYYNMFNISRIPDGAFRGMFRMVFTFVLPMTLVANVPAKALLLRMSSPQPVLMLVGMTIGWFIVSELFWRFSLRRYTSASS